jgi:hypothetical protein
MLHIKKGSKVAEVYKADDKIKNLTAIVITSPDLPKDSTYHLAISEFPTASDRDVIWLYAFKNDQLFYWGYPYQFRRHSDKEINAFGEAAMRYMIEQKIMDTTNLYYYDTLQR